MRTRNDRKKSPRTQYARGDEDKILGLVRHWQREEQEIVVSSGEELPASRAMLVTDADMSKELVASRRGTAETNFFIKQAY